MGEKIRRKGEKETPKPYPKEDGMMKG